MVGETDDRRVTLGTFSRTGRHESGAAHPVLIEPSLDNPSTALCVIDEHPSRAPRMESYPKFHNEVGVPIVRIGYREFNQGVVIEPLLEPLCFRRPWWF